MSAGIYAIALGDRLYVGSAVCIGRRWAQHRRHLQQGRHHNRHLQRAWAKHGPDAFAFKVLEEVGAKGQLLEREQHYLDALKPAFNVCKVAGSQQGMRHSDDTKRKLSDALKGRRRSAESIEKQRAAQRGRQIPVETRDKIAAAHRGVKLSEAHRAALRAARAVRAPHSPETKARMAAAQQARRAREAGQRVSAVE